MRESRTYGSVRGAQDETCVPTATASFLLRRLRLLPSDSAELAIAVSVNFGDVPGHAAEKRNGRCGANPEAHSRSTGLPLSADCGRQTTLA
jgi:hypothetical protein